MSFIEAFYRQMRVPLSIMHPKCFVGMLFEQRKTRQLEVLPCSGDVLHTIGMLTLFLISMNQSPYLAMLNENAFPSGDRFIAESFILQQAIVHAIRPE